MTDHRLVDEGISAAPGAWVFDRRVANHFDEHVRKSIPLYDEIQAMVVELCDGIVRPGSVVYDIGASTGETISRLRARYAHVERVRYIAVDESAPMLERAREKCGDDGVTYLERDAARMGSFPGADCVIALYTLQFIPEERRGDMLRRIGDSLAPGGALILAEKLVADDPATQRLWDEMHIRFKLQQGLSPEMIQHKRRSLVGVMAPLPLDENLGMLDRAGFHRVELFARWCAFVGIIAYKSPDETADAGEDRT